MTLPPPALIERALTLAISAFGRDIDRTGGLKVLHSLRVGLAGTTPEEIAAGFLHDVLEDTPVDATFLLDSDIPPAVVEAVGTVTRHKHETYRYFIERVARGPVLAIRVKLNDLADNLGRVGALGENERVGLSRRYEQARERLTLALAAREGGR